MPLLITVYLKPGMLAAKGDALQALPTPVHSYSLGGASGYFYNSITCVYLFDSVGILFISMAKDSFECCSTTKLLREFDLCYPFIFKP